MCVFVVCMCGCVCACRPQLPLSSSHLDVYAGPGMKGPAIAMTSNSCPANLTIKRELSGAKVKVLHFVVTTTEMLPSPIKDLSCN